MLSSKNKTPLQIVLHVLTWLILFLFPYFLSNNEPNDIIRLLRITWIPLFFSGILFYLNFFFLIESTLFKEKKIMFFGLNLVALILLTWAHIALREILVVPEVELNRRPPMPTKLIVYRDIISMIVTVVISFALKTNQRWLKIETEKKEQEKEVLKSELQHLKYQLQPHFFFNSLNTIYALIERSPALAQETVHDLSKLMRYLLYDTENGKAKLSDEIEFMKQYINLMKLRTSDKTIININFPSLSGQYYITPLLFISLIENAFKHGVSSTQNSEIFFSLTADKKTIRFIAENKNFPKTIDDKSGSGIGLNNLRKQLNLSYPGKHNFQTKVEDGLFKVMLEVYID